MIEVKRRNTDNRNIQISLQNVTQINCRTQNYLTNIKTHTAFIRGVIFFTNQHFITDWFVHMGVITYKWICRSYFFQLKLCLGQVMKLTKWQVIWDLCRSAKFWRNFAKFHKFLQNFAFRETGKLAHYEITSFC